MAKMPAQNPSTSKQDYATPPAFLDAAKALLAIEAWDADLAADDDNAVAWPYFTKSNSAFDAPSWKLGVGWNWLNPPYKDITPWVRRAYGDLVVEGTRTAVLIPASVGANWYRDYVHGRALVLALNGRLAFMPDKPTWLYPKDCILCLYAPTVVPGFEVWDWA